MTSTIRYPRLAQEFPTFDQSTLPEIPAGFFDESWAHEPCPCFTDNGRCLSLYIDFPDIDDRVHPAPRFSLHTMGEPAEVIASSETFADILSAIRPVFWICGKYDGPFAPDVFLTPEEALTHLKTLTPVSAEDEASIVASGYCRDVEDGHYICHEYTLDREIQIYGIDVRALAIERYGNEAVEVKFGAV